MNPSSPMNFSSSRGLLVAVEGPNRAGKSTLIEDFSRTLTSLGCSVICTREPGGTTLYEELRAILKSKSHAASAYASALIFEGGRQDHVDKLISPGIESGAVVITDRFWMSTEVYQRTALTAAQMDVIKRIHSTLPVPDLTVFLLPSPELLLSRGEDVGDRFYDPTMELANYRAYAVEYAKHYPAILVPVTLDSQDQVSSAVLLAFMKLLSPAEVL